MQRYFVCASAKTQQFRFQNVFLVHLFLLPDFSTLEGIEIKERKKRLVLVNLGFPTNDKGSLDTTFFRSWPSVISWKEICMMLSLFKVALA